LGHGHLVKKMMIHNQWITNYIQRCREITERLSLYFY